MEGAGLDAGPDPCLQLSRRCAGPSSVRACPGTGKTCQSGRAREPMDGRNLINLIVAGVIRLPELLAPHQAMGPGGEVVFVIIWAA